MNSELERVSPPLQGLQILVVDADAPSTRLIQAVLEDQGCALRVAATGQIALAMSGEVKPDIVLLELTLPDVSGFELVRLLKGNAATSNAVIVAVTASNGPETRRAVLEAGCTDYVRKPIDVLTFSARLQSYLGRPVESAGATSGRGADQ